MAINETVFHSLLMGHCLNRDKESVDATLEVTLNSYYNFLTVCGNWFIKKPINVGGGGRQALASLQLEPAAARPGSFSQRYGSEDLDSYRNVTDSEHWLPGKCSHCTVLKL